MEWCCALSGLLPEEIQKVCAFAERFRGVQVFRWIAAGCTDFHAMSDLSSETRARLARACVISDTRVYTTLRDVDGTLKLGIELKDKRRVEAVLLVDQVSRKTACLSCQVGCPMACAFCQTGQLGFARNLSASEIVEQFLHLERCVGTLDNVVFMGMGEPMLNLDAVCRAIEILSHPQGRDLSEKRITISTSGHCRGIYSLADRALQVRLAVSLTTANAPLRARLMPRAAHESLAKLKSAIRYFNEKSGKRVTLELALMRGVNTSERHAQEVIDFAHGLNVHVNLIPWNPVASIHFETPREVEVAHFEALLMRARIPVTRRYQRGNGIGGACGQLGKTAGV